MDHSGMLVMLPFDLRIPFARYVARNNILNLKRYCIERVFRPRKLDRFHPKELLECAFDIVTSTTNSSLPTAEVIYTICEIIQEFPALQERNYSIYLNHTTLLKAILLHCGIPEDKLSQVYVILYDAVTEKLTRREVEAKFCNLSLSSNSTVVPTSPAVCPGLGLAHRSSPAVALVWKTMGTAAGSWDGGVSQREGRIRGLSGR